METVLALKVHMHEIFDIGWLFYTLPHANVSLVTTDVVCEQVKNTVKSFYEPLETCRPFQIKENKHYKNMSV